MGARRYNTGKLKWSLIDYKSIIPMVKVLMYGAHKYSVFEDEKGNIITGAEISPEAAGKLKVSSSGQQNWRKGLSVTECSESLMRHLLAFMAGEDNDPESGESHLGHIQCNAMFLQYARDNQPELDDRFKEVNAKQEEL